MGTLNKRITGIEPAYKQSKSVGMTHNPFQRVHFVSTSKARNLVGGV